MKTRFGFGIAALALLLAFGISGCPTGGGGDDGGDDTGWGSLSKISFTDIPGLAAGTDQVTRIWVTVKNAAGDQAMGVAVAGGTLSGVDGDVPAIAADGTAEIELYDGAAFIVFIAAREGGLNPALPGLKKSVSSANEITVVYSTTADGDNESIRPRIWKGEFKDPHTINWAENTEPKVLVINNIPPAAELTGGKGILGVGIVTSLADPNDNTLRVAGGIGTGTTPTRTVALYQMAGGSLPDFTKAWTGYGPHYIVLGTSANGAPPNYVYTAGTEFGVDGGGAKKFDFNQGTSTLDWADFRLQPVGTLPPVEKALKVTGGIAEDIVGASLIEGDSISNAAPAAIGTLSGETFTFFEPTAEQLPDTAKPWTGSGEYMIVLATAARQSGPMYWYTEGGELFDPSSQPTGVKKYNFTEATTTIHWDQFKPMTAVAPNTEEKVLILTNIPPAAELIGGKQILGLGIVTSLEDPNDNTLRVAGGIAIGTTPTRTVVLAGMVDGLPFGPMWTGNGPHYIVLGTSANGAAPNYVYTAGTNFGEEGGGAKKYDFNKATSTLDWDQFREQPVTP